jgi:DNA-binding transcriptional regulator YiaG
MLSTNEYPPMTKMELDELMALNGWSKTRLAAELHLTEAAVYKWFRMDGVPDGPTSILLRIWLEDARARASRKHKALAV